MHHHFGAQYNTERRKQRKNSECESFRGKTHDKKTQKQTSHNFVVKDLQGIKFGFVLGAMSW